MTDKERLMKIVNGFEPYVETYSDLVDTILAAGFGDVSQMERELVDALNMVRDANKRIAELEIIAQRAGDVEKLREMLNKYLTGDIGTIDVKYWLLNGEGKDGA